MSLFGDLFDFVVSTVVDVVETAGTIVVDTVELAGSVAVSAIDVAADFAEGSVNIVSDVAQGLVGVVDDGLDLTGELIAGLIGVIVASNSSDTAREAAEIRYERHIEQLRQQSDNAIQQYQQQQQKTYEYHVNQSLYKQQKRLKYQAFQQLRYERDTIRLYISQLKPRKDHLKTQLNVCADMQQRKLIKTEIQALNKLLNPLYEQLKRIKLQFDQLHQGN